MGMSALVLLMLCNSSKDVAGIQGSGHAAAVRGPITRFGSIFVDGVEYSTAGASVRIDGQPGTESQLRAGQIVTMNGTINPNGVTGTAIDVSYDGNVQGQVTQVDSAAGTFAVLGQTVRVNGATLLDDAIQPGDLTGLAPGSTVEVSGFANTSGEIVASRIDLKAAGSALQVIGTVHALDTSAQTFSVNSLLVSYAGASVSGTLFNGGQVEVHGLSLTADGELTATQIDPAPSFNPAVTEHVDLTGIITGLSSLLAFTLDGNLVLIDLNTQLQLNGIPLGLNVEVDVQGTVIAPHVFLATKIEVKSEGASLLNGVVQSLTGGGVYLKVLGVTVSTSNTTEWVDNSILHLRLFRSTDLRVGDTVQVRGTASQSGTVTAATVERQNTTLLGSILSLL
jgi:hypothetical protein